jgi:hypothetical protein
MKLGFRSPVYLRKPVVNHVRDAASLERAAKVAAREMSLNIIGGPHFNSKIDHARRSIGYKVEGKDGPRWLKVNGCEGLPFLGELDAQALHGIAKPEIFGVHVWHKRNIRWQALLMTLSPGNPISETPWISENSPLVDEACLLSLKENLARVAKFPTPKIRLHTAELFQFLSVHECPPVTELVTNHGDVHWAHICQPFFLLDWEHFGAAPRGFDAAYLLSFSLKHPALCARLKEIFKDELYSPSGIASQIFCLSRQYRNIANMFVDVSYKPLVDAELNSLKY